MTPDYTELMAVIGRALRARGWTRARLAEELGMSESGVKKALRAPDGSYDRVVRICAALGLDLSELLEECDASPEAWRLTEEQEDLFRADPACWWFLGDLAGRGWDADAVRAEQGLDARRVEDWLVRLERRGVLRRTERGRIVPIAAAGRPWQAGSRHGDAVVRPAQDALLAHARDRIRSGTDVVPEATECGFARLELTPSSAVELKAALREVVSDFARRSRRERAVHGRGALVPVGVLTASAPFVLGALGIEVGAAASPE